jgi:S-adenosylmethionine:tRNA ribosyltransferase-isomerase
MHPDDRIELYDYTLPEELIAQVPADRRDASRLMVVERDSRQVRHHQFVEFPELLAPGDLLVMNDTRVLPARLIGFRTATGGKWEGLFLREEPEGRWRIIGQTRGRLQPGESITLLPADPSRDDHSKAASSVDGTSPELLLVLERQADEGAWIVRPQSSQPQSDPIRTPVLDLLERFGTMPLPHYMHRDARPEDWERYQTTYAARPGAVAAPTAGLHFTPEILERCRERGIATARVTLHVGLGTFRPISVSRLSEHRMHHEWCELPAETVEAIRETKAHGGRVIAVGTTTVRTLEAAVRQSAASGGRESPARTSNDVRIGGLTPPRSPAPWRGETDLFIKPPFEFQVVDAMLTNFHLPQSTLLVLVATFAGRERILRAYAEAIEQRYRFYSYGDAMLIT